MPSAVDTEDYVSWLFCFPYIPHIKIIIEIAIERRSSNKGHDMFWVVLSMTMVEMVKHLKTSTPYMM